MLLRELLDVLEAIAPIRYAEPWDNGGLLAGDPQQPVARVMCTIDYTRAVADEARSAKCDCVIAYHPPIFEAVKRVAAGSLIYDAIRRGVAIYSPHTALDVAEGGTNDLLADASGLADRRPLRLAQGKSASCKLIVFTPQNAVERVSEAMFAAGAGRIGNYSSCSFRSPGLGTFFGEAGAVPTIGEAGKLEQVDEIRLEMVVPIALIDAVVGAMRRVHPYEEPAFDLMSLLPEPDWKGQGRIGELPAPLERAVVLESIQRVLGVPQLLVAGPREGKVTPVGLLGGAGGGALNNALVQKAELYLTGEVRHHDALRAASAGMTVVCALHSNT